MLPIAEDEGPLARVLDVSGSMNSIPFAFPSNRRNGETRCFSLCAFIYDSNQPQWISSLPAIIYKPRETNEVGICRAPSSGEIIPPFLFLSLSFSLSSPAFLSHISHSCVSRTRGCGVPSDPCISIFTFRRFPRLPNGIGIDFPFRMKSSSGHDGGLTHSPENSRECKLRSATSRILNQFFSFVPARFLAFPLFLIE